MVAFLNLSEERRKIFISQTAVAFGILESSVEKDWWVTLVLKALFNLPMKKYFIFKGGTSLSKAWNLISRFSEDIDIALDPEAFEKPYQQAPGRSYVQKLKKRGCKYTSDEIAAALKAELLAMGVPEDLFKLEVEEVNPQVPDKDPQTIFIHYQPLFEPPAYNPPRVKVEIGVRSLKEPFLPRPLRSMIGEKYGNTEEYKEEPFEVVAVVPHKTMIEKCLLLHEKFAAYNIAGKIGERQSRHLSDLVALKKASIHTEILKDLPLLSMIVEHRRHYVALTGIDYSQMTINALKFIPPADLLADFEADYNTMKESMIYGENVPTFNEIIDELTELTCMFKLHGRLHQLGNIVDIAIEQYKGDTKASLSQTVTYFKEVDPTKAAAEIAGRYIVHLDARGAGVVLRDIDIVE